MTQEPFDRLRKLRIDAGFSNPQKACDRFGWNFYTYKSHENGARGISAKKAAVYAAAYKTTPEYILFGHGSAADQDRPFHQPAKSGGAGEAAYQPRPATAVPDIATDKDGILDFAFGTGEMVPVYGMAAGTLGDREAVFNDGNILDYVPVHPAQRGVKDAFALRVTGESMEPRYKEGEIVYLHPTLWPAREQDCVIEFENGNALLKTYMGQTEEEIRCRQYNPDQDMTFPKSKIKALYAVLGRN